MSCFLVKKKTEVNLAKNAPRQSPGLSCVVAHVNSQIAEKPACVFLQTGCFRNESRIVGFHFPDSWNA